MNVKRAKVERVDTFVRFRRMRFWFAVFLGVACTVPVVWAQSTQPLVAIHDSELTRALESMPASGATPKGTGTTGYQWWATDWPHYFVMPESLQEALRSDSTALTTVGDSNINSGLLLPNGQPDGFPRPSITSITQQSDGSMRITGNGMGSQPLLPN
jgi:hypothetical protein